MKNHNEMENETRVAVMGLGREGIDLLRFLHKIKAQPVALDRRTKTELGIETVREVNRLSHYSKLGKNYLTHLEDFDVVFRSQGVPINLPEIKAAVKRGVKFSSWVKLFFDLSPAQIVGVTGTKGKGTTASLIAHLLKGTGGRRVHLGGNIGKPLLSILPKLTNKDVVVLELSNFQLEDLGQSSHIAVVLNITPDHLDRHKTFANYLKAKSNVWRHQSRQDYLVTSADHLVTQKIAKEATGQLLRYSIKRVLPRGLYRHRNEIIYRDVKTGKRQVVMQVSDVPLLGTHNLENTLAAIGVALTLGVPISEIPRRLKSFAQLQYRLEPAGESGGVKFINDSLSTTPESAMAALCAIDGPIAPIVGGKSKGLKIDELVELLASHRSIAGIVLMGETAFELEKGLKRHKISTPYKLVKSLSAAVRAARKYVSSGGTVLLSPGFASFDMFKNVYDRGEQFNRLVRKLTD